MSNTVPKVTLTLSHHCHFQLLRALFDSHAARRQ